MIFPSLKNFLYVPGNPLNREGVLYTLSPGAGYGKNMFVLLPYQNPQTKKTEPRFYNIVKKQIVPTPSRAKEIQAPQKIKLKARLLKADYLERVKQLKEHIQQGNIYEINYCTDFFNEDVIIDPVSVFLKLQSLAKAPYSALLKLEDDFIICASPELFLRKEKNTIYTKPIKGTIRRGKNKEEDEALKRELQSSLKERTENVMAVDVARNDLSMFAKKGSVHVNKLYNIETFETVHQMVSTVSCDIKENTSFEKIIESAFPMASMTGAPKLKAMTLIDEFENFKRNTYSGAMGIIDEHENYNLSVIIRSIFYNQNTKRVSISVGGAITYLSDPNHEYEECLLKAGALLKALNAEIE